MSDKKDSKINIESQVPEKQADEKEILNVPGDEDEPSKEESEQKETKASKKKKDSKYGDEKKGSLLPTEPLPQNMLHASKHNKMTVLYALENVFIQKVQEIETKRNKTILIVTDEKHDDLFASQGKNIELIIHTLSTSTQDKELIPNLKILVKQNPDSIQSHIPYYANGIGTLALLTTCAMHVNAFSVVDKQVLFFESSGAEHKENFALPLKKETDKELQDILDAYLLVVYQAHQIFPKKSAFLKGHSCSSNSSSCSSSDSSDSDSSSSW
jgi:hypothetical protein